MTVPQTTPPSASGTPGYLRTLKTLSVQAIQSAFTVSYPESDPQGGTQPVYCSLDYPVSAAMYPSIWVTYAPAMLQTAGIDYIEGDSSKYARWRFSGTISFTVAALSNNERDLIYDQLISILAFASQSEVESPFRAYVENSPLIESTWSFDQLESAGHGEAPGTPWGTPEVIYEDTVSLQVLGEFTSDPVSLSLVPLSKIIVTATATEEPGGGVLGTFTDTIVSNTLLLPSPASEGGFTSISPDPADLA